jgi:cardiolipin synthase (CMP-forming)
MPRFKQVLYAPNQLTLLRLIFIPFVIVSIVVGAYGTAFALVLVAGISDGLDGLLARRLGQQTDLGTYLDPIADKLLLTSSFVALGLDGRIPLWLVILVLSRDVIILVTALVMVLTTSLRSFPPSLYGKINTIGQVATVLATLLLLLYAHAVLRWLQLGAVYTTAAFTVISGLHYAFRTADQLRRLERAP